MNFAISEEQDELRRSVRFLEDKSPSTDVRRLMETTDGYDTKLWAQMANELGLQSLHVPEVYGGQGFLVRRVDRGAGGDGPGAPVCAVLRLGGPAANAILNAGTEEQKAALLPGIAAGETIATVAFTEPSGKWDANGITMEAASDGSGGDTLSGTKMFVLDGHTADLIVVAARSAGSGGTGVLRR